MAYMRGENYLWRDDDGLHIWCANGYDAWDCSWDAEGAPPSDDDHRPSGVCIRQEVIDEYVVMRLCELIEEGSIDETIERSLAKWSRPSLERVGPSLKQKLAL